MTSEQITAIIAIAIPCIMLIATVVFYLYDFLSPGDSPTEIKKWNDTCGDKEIVQFIKNDLIKQENEELRRAIKQTSCSTKEFEVALDQKSKKLQPLLCKMCGGTVAKKGDNYECEYCGLKYEWR